MTSKEILYKRGEDNESDDWDDSALIKAYDDAISAMKTKLAKENPDFAPPQASTKKKKKNKSKKRPSSSASSRKWKFGDRCKAVYTRDGEIYDARIVSLDQDRKVCTVQYTGYGNKEEHKLSALLSPGSNASSHHNTDTASETESVTKNTMATEPHTSQKSKSKKSLNSQQNGAFPLWSSAPSIGQMRPPPIPQQPPPFSHMPAPPPFGAMPSGPNVIPDIPPPPPLFAQTPPSGNEQEALYSMLISWYMSGYNTGYYQGLRQASSTGAASRKKNPR